MTQSGFVSLIILSKSDARYFFGGLTPAPARFGLMKFSAVSRRPGLVSQRATSSLPCGKVLVIAVRYMRERDPTPTFTYLRRGAAAWTMPDMPTAAAPATLRTERRSYVKSLISLSPNLWRPDCWRIAGRRKDTSNSLKCAQPRASGRRCRILRRDAHAAFMDRRPRADRSALRERRQTHRSTRAGDAPQPGHHRRRQVGALHGGQWQLRLHRGHHGTAN